MRQPRPNSLMKGPEEGEATKHNSVYFLPPSPRLICIHPAVSCVGGAFVHYWCHLIVGSGGLRLIIGYKQAFVVSALTSVIFGELDVRDVGAVLTSGTSSLPATWWVRSSHGNTEPAGTRGRGLISAALYGIWPVSSILSAPPQVSGALSVQPSSHFCLVAR